MKKKMTMDDYIRETPMMIRENTKRNKVLTETLVQEYLGNEYATITMIACGSSYNACVCARPFMREVLKKEVKVVTPYTYENYENDLLDNSFKFVISQSGCSTNAIRALEKMKKLGQRTIGITADLKSDFSDAICDVVIDYGVGVETFGCVTKGMVGLVLYLMLFALNAAKEQQSIDTDTYQKYFDEICKSADIHEDIYKNTIRFFNNNQKSLLSMQTIYVVSAGANYGCAIEAALKMGESIRVPSAGYELEEYVHGPNAQLTPNYSVFFIDNNDGCSDHLVNIYEATQKITDHCFIISNNPKIDGDKVIRTSQSTNGLVSVLYNLAAVEYIAFKATDMLDGWKTHPLFKDFEQKVKIKTEKCKYEDFD